MTETAEAFEPRPCHNPRAGIRLEWVAKIAREMGVRFFIHIFLRKNLSLFSIVNLLFVLFTQFCETFLIYDDLCST
ncbi:hypothetical protein GYMLUDRAFT_396562 [Collybiopsis luxurians FD-317 M1]|uniref:Uncharacterized protein n=1 Tax=Collybiopsis luxurians FD-317 M1 TaxID=944289 RepID=A0A0D0C0X0_9AGAR|nr:hypothetical protein GYMLUDRAFT_396562 [Collybiopsis luxurians FD-317 M1]